MKRTILILLLTVFLAACASVPPTPEEVKQITVLYTNDEHGWLAGMEEGQGAAELAGLWREEFGYSPDGDFLLLSGGDNWTGPAVSTWFDGESMVEIMNAMGYRASVIGNHEFDFGLDALQMRLEEANFPYLSANIRYKRDGSTPVDLGIRPYTVIEVDGVKIGLTGLTTTLTPSVTDPKKVVDFQFIDYDQALREVAPAMKAEGAELILAPAHICMDELRVLASEVADLGIAMLGGGHCNELAAEQVGDIVLLSGGYHLTSYAYVTFRFSPATGTLGAEYGVAQNQNGSPDPEVAAIADRWLDKAETELNVTIGYLEQDVGRRSEEIAALIPEAWLWAYPNADIALTNSGGIRDGLRAGEVTLADVVSVMPFNNVLVEVHLTGRQLERVLRAGGEAPPVGGAHQERGKWILDSTGQQLDPVTVYSLLVNDFMYSGGDQFQMLAEYDPDAYNTAIDWRQPVIDWIRAQDSNPARPLDPVLEAFVD